MRLNKASGELRKSVDQLGRFQAKTQGTPDLVYLALRRFSAEVALL